MLDASVVDQIARDKVIRAIKNDVTALNQPFNIRIVTSAISGSTLMAAANSRI